MRKFFVVSLVCLFVSSCSIVDSGPSNKEVKEIFTQYFQNNLPLSWAGSLLGGKLKKLDKLEVKRGGSLKKKNGGRLPELYAMAYEDCWPVTVRAKGVAMANMIFSQQAHAFEKEGNFLLCKNYHGQWEVEGNIFQ